MLGYRYETFLTLCKIGSYTKTAECLHITQPAVSQHIKFLEKYYGGKLFHYEGKTLTLTQRGRLLYNFALTMHADSKKLRGILSMQNNARPPVVFGATLTIGEYVMPPILARTMMVYGDLHITMSVDNTEVLLGKLRDGKIDFALLEGRFDKSEYSGAVFAKESFIAVCGKDSPLAGVRVTMDELLAHRLILREKGSGTRDVFEQILCQQNLTIESFSRVCEIGNMNAIKQLVCEGLGITFLYREAVQRELADGQMVELVIDSFSEMREFNFVFLKNSKHQKEYMEWYSFFRNARNPQDATNAIEWRGTEDI